MKKSNLILALSNMAFLLLFVGCNPNDNSVSTLKKGTVFAGKPGNFNGTWTGLGSVTLNSNTTSSLSFTFDVSQLPKALNLFVNIKGETVASLYHLDLGNHHVIKNIISNELGQVVGDIGADGFTVREPQGSLLAVLNELGSMNLQGVIVLPDAQTVSFEASITKK